MSQSHLPIQGNRVAKPASSIACLAFVVLLAVAFWAGVVWIAQALLAMI